MSWIRVVSLSLVFLGLFALAGGAQSNASASSSASTAGGPVDVRVSGFAFEVGSRVALEFLRNEDVDCFGPGVIVRELSLTDAEGGVTWRAAYDQPLEVDAWLGRVDLVDPDGRPLPTGRYSLLVTTGVGSFSVDLEIAEASRFRELGRSSASASVCGLSLQIYRLLTDADRGASGTLRIGDRLLVALEGNPTTGYAWTNTLLYEFEALRELCEVEYRADSSLLGAGGLFLFRYEAVAPGPQAFRFAYARPWESGEPLDLVEFTVDVR